ncbi:MAG: PAS domain-containing sensor histidine kinase [Alphaproteobacteria bacterium]
MESGGADNADGADALGRAGLDVLLAAVFQAGPAFYVAQCNGDIVVASNAYRELSRHFAKGQVLVDETWRAFGNTVAKRAILCRQVAQSGQQVSVLEQLTIGNATYAYDSVHTAVRDESGQVVGVMGTYRDSTGEARQRTRAAALESRLDDITRSMTDWIWETDADWRLCHVSSNITHAVGLPPAMLHGVALADIGSFVDGEGAQRIIASHRPFRGLAFAIKAPGGETRTFRLSGVPAFEPASGRFAGYRGTGTDTTLQERAAEAMRVAREEAEMASRGKSEFIANMSHELRTPLNSILGFSEIIGNAMFGPIGNAKYKEYGQLIHESASHLLDLITDVLDFSRLDAHKRELFEEDVDVADVVRRVVRLLSERAHRAGLDLDVQAPENLPSVYADERAIKQVLLNLLSNAVKFTPQGGRIEVAVMADPSGDLLIAVSDTGIGISRDKLTHIFEPFTQADASLSRRYDGVGLGLHLARGLMHLHGGDLSIDSEEGKGTRVTARLPAVRVGHRRSA